MQPRAEESGRLPIFEYWSGGFQDVNASAGSVVNLPPDPAEALQEGSLHIELH